MIEASHLPAVAELVRIPSPAPAPQALAHDGEHLWIGSFETSRIYGLDPIHGTVFEQTSAPGRPIGATMLGDEMRFVIGDGDTDDRTIRRYVPGHGFKSSDVLPCPDATGSFLAYDGTDLWLSQRHLERVHRLDAHGAPARTIDVGEEIIGLAWSGERLYCSLWLGSKTGRCRIGYVVPSSPAPALVVVATLPFVGVSLACDGERFWTNDFKANEIVAYAIPAA
ncbi:MAG: hypothetical protein IAI48_13340 [Candidatus Eremiobacteraeota bacterium]|nr:hypothetical protein [Candidatus Eremiobacteraeota bacterium]